MVQSVRLAALVLSLALAACARPEAPSMAGPDAAAMAALFASPLSPYQRWLDVAARFAAARAGDGACAGESPCPATQWRALVAELRELPPRERVRRANAALNRIPYVAAERNWGDPFHWETPYEFLARGGQCQDYAIAKYLALAESGFPRSDLRILVVRDRAHALDHAVAVAVVDGAPLILDNLAADIVGESAALARYAPYYAIDAGGWHGYAAAQDDRQAPRYF